MAAIAQLYVSLGLTDAKYKRGLRNAQKQAKTVTRTIQNGLNRLNFRNFLFGSAGIYAVQRAMRATLTPAMELQSQLAQISTMLFNN
ncbi:unnamed protein product [marine sediment metagenome]|uniref:Uncharacterized protein n=1 Tax=marine sediment metagenome TaxID=412755 RepID=X1B0X3_9ZZZZ